MRQPLASLDVAVERPTELAPYEALIAAELNVKNVRPVTIEDFTAANPVERRLTVNARTAGPRIGKAVQDAIKGSKTGDWSETDGVVTSGGIRLEEGEYELATVMGGQGDDAVVASALPRGGFVSIDTTITPDLEAEGYARDLIRSIQDARKSKGLNVADRIALTLTVPAERIAAVEAHRDLIAGEVLATSFDVTVGDDAIRLVKA